MIDLVTVSDDRLDFDGPGTFEVEGDIEETIEVEAGKSRTRKLPALDKGVTVNGVEVVAPRPPARIKVFVGPTKKILLNEGVL